MVDRAIHQRAVDYAVEQERRRQAMNVVPIRPGADDHSEPNAALALADGIAQLMARLDEVQAERDALVLQLQAPLRANAGTQMASDAPVIEMAIMSRDGNGAMRRVRLTVGSRVSMMNIARDSMGQMSSLRVIPE